MCPFLARVRGYLVAVLLLTGSAGCGRLRFEERDPDSAVSQYPPAQDASEALDAASEALDADSPGDGSVEPEDAATGTDGSCAVEPCPARGPVLHWPFDEASGSTALDRSPHGFDGTYMGDNGAPVASPLVAPLQFADPASRAFTLADRHAVRLVNMPAALRPALEFTLSIWYRAVATESSGSELISGGNHYLLRLKPSGLEFSKRVSDGLGGGLWMLCLPVVPTPLDGAWHHVAGVSSGSGMVVYFDGGQVCSNTDDRAVLYDLSGSDFWVGRHGNLDGRFDFEGNLDDARFYDRALSPAEIAALAAGAE